MLLNSRQLAYLAMLLAICEILLYLGCVIEFNTLSLICLAAFCASLACMIGGLRGGLIHVVSAVLLGWLILPQKEYLLTYLGLGLYVLMMEEGEPLLIGRVSKGLIWLIKLGLFNLFLVPGLLIFPQVFVDQVQWWTVLAAFVLANVLIVLLDVLYHRFMLKYGRRLRVFFKKHGAAPK